MITKESVLAAKKQHFSSLKLKEFDLLLEKAASKIGCSVNILELLIFNESGFNPVAKNPITGCFGLIQFNPIFYPTVPYLERKGFDSWVDQITLVEQHFIGLTNGARNYPDYLILLGAFSPVYASFIFKYKIRDQPVGMFKAGSVTPTEAAQWDKICSLKPMYFMLLQNDWLITDESVCLSNHYLVMEKKYGKVADLKSINDYYTNVGSLDPIVMFKFTQTYLRFTVDQRIKDIPRYRAIDSRIRSIYPEYFKAIPSNVLSKISSAISSITKSTDALEEADKERDLMTNTPDSFSIKLI